MIILIFFSLNCILIYRKIIHYEKRDFLFYAYAVKPKMRSHRHFINIWYPFDSAPTVWAFMDAPKRRVLSSQSRSEESAMTNSRLIPQVRYSNDGYFLASLLVYAAIEYLKSSLIVLCFIVDAILQQRLILYRLGI